MAPRGGVGDFVSARDIYNRQAVSRSGTPPTKHSIKSGNPENHTNNSNLPANERRRWEAEKARVSLPVKKTEYNDSRIAPIKPESQEISVSRALGVFNGDVENIDDVERSPKKFYDTELDESTLSHELQSDENDHQFAESHFRQQQDDEAPRTSSPGHQELLYDQARHGQNYPMEDHDGNTEEGSEEDFEDESGSDGYPAEDDPTINSAISLGLVARQEKDDLVVFMKNQPLVSPLSHGRLPIHEQSVLLNGITPYPSTRSSETSLIPYPPPVGIHQDQQGPSQAPKYQSENPSKAFTSKPPKVRRGDRPFHGQQQAKHKTQQHHKNKPTGYNQERNPDEPFQIEGSPGTNILLPHHQKVQEPPSHSPSNTNEIAVEDPRPLAMSNVLPTNPEIQSTILAKRPVELDYALSDLSKLSYSTLQAQPFEHDPHSTPPALPSHLSSASMAEQLSFITTPPNLQNPQNPSTPNLTTFLSSLPIEQYEECGDLIIEQFSTLLNKFKDARRRKRDKARAFEEEITKKEEDVREKREAIEGEVRRLGSGVREIVTPRKR